MCSSLIPWLYDIETHSWCRGYFNFYSLDGAARFDPLTTAASVTVSSVVFQVREASNECEVNRTFAESQWIGWTRLDRLFRLLYPIQQQTECLTIYLLLLVWLITNERKFETAWKYSHDFGQSSSPSKFLMRKFCKKIFSIELGRIAENCKELRQLKSKKITRPKMVGDQRWNRIFKNSNSSCILLSIQCIDLCLW